MARSIGNILLPSFKAIPPAAPPAFAEEVATQLTPVPTPEITPLVSPIAPRPTAKVARATRPPFAKTRAPALPAIDAALTAPPVRRVVTISPPINPATPQNI